MLSAKMLSIDALVSLIIEHSWLSTGFRRIHRVIYR